VADLEAGPSREREEIAIMKVLICLLSLCVFLPASAPAVEALFPGFSNGPPMPLRSDTQACWSNPVDLNGGPLSSEIIAEFGLESEAADDFLMNYTREILRVRWWGSFW
jgi:hypothetical protein